MFGKPDTDYTCVGPFAISVVFAVPLSREMGFVPGLFGRFDLAALVQPHLEFLFVCLYCTSGLSGLPDG